jgi:hypothetical protein
MTAKDKDTIQETPVKVEASSAEPRTVEVLSAQDSAVADLVKEAPNTLDIERAILSVKENKLPNILELPEECKALHGIKYRFRWLAKDKNLEAKLRSSIWSLCTRVNSPYIKKHRFKSHGAVEQAGMLLAFAAEEVAKVREQLPAQRSADLVKHYTEDLAKSGSKEKGGFYKPETGAEEDESDEGIVIE